MYFVDIDIINNFMQFVGVDINNFYVDFAIDTNRFM